MMWPCLSVCATAAAHTPRHPHAAVLSSRTFCRCELGEDTQSELLPFSILASMYSAKLKSDDELGPLWPLRAALTLVHRLEAHRHHRASCWEFGGSMDDRACMPRLHSMPLNVRGLPAR